MKRKPLLSAVLITRNGARMLEACLRSVRFADETVVLDAGSTDATVAIAQRMGAHVFLDRRPPGGFGPARNLAMTKARGSWILFIDSDETATPGLRREILRTIRARDSADAYEIPRRNFYFGRWVRRGGRYPDRQRRLLRRGKARYRGEIHEHLDVHGRLGRLSQPLDHHPYPDLDEYLRKLGFYAAEQARLLRARGVRPGLLTAARYRVLKPLSRFTRRYFLKLGFLDGVPGFFACLHDALTYIFTYTYLRAG